MILFWNSGWLMWSLRVLNKIEVLHLFIMWPPVITLTSQYLKKVACPFPRYYYTYLPCEFGCWLDLRLMSECVCRDFGTRSWFSSFISGIKYSMVSISLRMLYKSTQITKNSFKLLNHGLTAACSNPPLSIYQYLKRALGIILTP